MNKYKLSFKSISELLKYIEEQEVQFIDFSFTDINSSWQHISWHHSNLDKTVMNQGIPFDDSIICNISNINKNSKTALLLKPDITQITYDPFSAQRTIKIFCDIHDANTKSPYIYDPRSIAKRAESYLKKSGIADTSYISPQTEFLIFEDKPSPSWSISSSCSQADHLSDLRSEMLSVIESMGVSVIGHNRKAYPEQCVINIDISTFLQSADNFQIYKFAVKNVAKSYGKSATFMPKPINNYKGSSMHLLQSLWKSGKPLFAGKSHANLSETALYYIGGILKHARALNAFTNPSINSYKRLTQKNDAPISLSYSDSNNLSACTIPFATLPKQICVETRFPDPLANPYFAFSAMLMAGLDGIENKIHPGDIIEGHTKDISSIPQLCSSLSEAISALKNDNDFLLKGKVFNSDIINSYIELKTKEIEHYKSITHSAEINMYY